MSGLEEEIIEELIQTGSTNKESITVQIANFSNLLDSISSIDERQKMLWKQIYENAVTDRASAHIAYVDLYIMVHSKEDKHAIHGQTLAKYLERMEKSNTQLLKLVELVSAAKSEDVETSVPEGRDLYKLLETNSASKSKRDKS